MPFLLPEIFSKKFVRYLSATACGNDKDTFFEQRCERNIFQITCLLRVCYAFATAPENGSNLQGKAVRNGRTLSVPVSISTRRPKRTKIPLGSKRVANRTIFHILRKQEKRAKNDEK